MNEIGQVVLNIVIPICVVMVLYVCIQLLVHLAAYLTAKLQAKQAEAQAAGDTAAAAMFDFALTVLNSVTHAVVASIEAQKGYNLRKAVKAGEAKAEELNLLSIEAYQEIVEILSEEVKTCLDEVVDDTETFIRDKIEEVLPAVKADYKKTLTEAGGTDGYTEKAED